LKLIIQIPCFNEAESLPGTLAELPREVDGFDEVRWLVVNDGSTDRTVAVAREHGVDYVVNLPVNRGLAAAFVAGIDASIRAGADVIVNTDADNQYCAADIPRLTAPILAGEAEFVVGARPIDQTAHFSPIKKLLQKLGSAVVRFASRTRVADAPSGFRALTREAAMRLSVLSEYTYTLETIIQAGQKGMAIASVPIRTNGPTRPSRLVKSIPSYVRRSLGTIVRIFMVYRPLKFFAVAGALPFLLGVLLCLRWLLIFFIELFITRPEQFSVNAPSLIAAAVLILGGLQLWTFGLVADLMAANRSLIEDVRFRVRRMETGGGGTIRFGDQAGELVNAESSSPTAEAQSRPPVITESRS